MAIADIEALIADQTREAAEILGADATSRAIEQAVNRYDLDRPNTEVVDLPGSSDRFYDLPTNWVDGFSFVVSLEAPIGGIPPAYVSSEDWRLYQSPSATQLLITATGLLNVAVRLTHTVPHQLDDVADTIPEPDRQALALWAVAELMDQLATHYTGDQESAFDADTSNFKSKGRDYAKRAEALRQRYYDHLGISPKRAVAAGTVKTMRDLDSRGRSRLFRRG